MKKIITVHIGEEMRFETDTIGTKCYINDVIKWLNEVKSQGATEIQWDAEKDWDGCIEAVNGQAFLDRIETDEEYNARLAESTRIQEQHNKNIEIMERKKYEELKKKYENKAE